MNQARALSIKTNSLEYTQAKQIGIGIGKEWNMFYITKKWNYQNSPWNMNQARSLSIKTNSWENENTRTKRIGKERCFTLQKK